MTFFWKCSNGPSKFGKSFAWSNEDVGREYVCQVTFFSGPECTDAQYVGHVTSEAFTICAALPVPDITTTWLPDAVVGEAYYAKVECSDPDAVFGEMMGSELSDFGLYITQRGEIEGTPTKTGNCHVNLTVTGEGGEGYKTFTLTVTEAPTQPATEPATKPATEPTAEPSTEPGSQPTAPTGEGQETSEATQAATEPLLTRKDPAPSSFPWWGYVLIAAAALGLGTAVAIFLVKRRK